MKVIVDNFLENVERQLHKKGWSRSEFARRLGKTPGYVTQILNRHHEPGLRVVEEWADALNVDAWTLLRKSQKSAKV